MAAVGLLLTLFSATAGLGVLLLWTGLAFLLSGSALVRWGGGFVLAAMIGGVAISVAGSAPRATPRAPRVKMAAPVRPMTSTPPPALKKAPFIDVHVQSSEYEHGYLTIVGTVENTGTAPAYSPSLEVSVRDAAGDVLLNTETVHPTATFLKNLEPNTTVAFESIVRVPGEPNRVRWGVRLNDYDGSVDVP